MVGGQEETRGGRMCGSRSACPRVTSRSWFHMLNWPQCPAVEKIPGKVSGAWLFAGPRVPVSAWCENREEGATVDKFREWFPGVTRAQVERVLDHAQRSLVVVQGLRVRLRFHHGPPVALRRSLSGHSVSTAFQPGRGTLQNGDLLRAAELDRTICRRSPLAGDFLRPESPASGPPIFRAG